MSERRQRNKNHVMSLAAKQEKSKQKKASREKEKAIVSIIKGKTWPKHVPGGYMGT